MSFENLFDDLRARVEGYGVQVKSASLNPETPGKFDGPTITLNTACGLEARCYYLAHSLGSIVQWSADPAGSRAAYDGLHEAKATKDADPARFAEALRRYLRFEETSSEYAVWLIADAGHGWAVPGYTLFFRADLESMRQFHTTGAAPVWRDFFADWKERVSRGEAVAEPFQPRPIPPFRPAHVQTQEVVREVDGKP